MADNYTQFSFVLEHLTKAEIKWIKKILSYSIDIMGDITDDAVKLAKILRTKTHGVTGESIEYWPEFAWAWLKKNSLQIYDSEECGNELNVATFVHAFLATFRPKDIVCFGVAYTCSKARPYEFSGQDFIITAHDIISTGEIGNRIWDTIKSKRDQSVDFSSIVITIHKFKRGERK